MTAVGPQWVPYTEEDARRQFADFRRWLAGDDQPKEPQPMTAADLQRFLDERHLQRKEAGALLAVSQDRLRRWLSGAQPIPRHISLACAALAYGLPEWPARAS